MRKLAIAAAAVLMFLALAASRARGETFTLQQGTSGYAGCTDSHIQADGYGTSNNTNYGTQSDLMVKREHYVYY
ncbi:MAG: hypothetical protein ACYTFI_26780 [Planctomycetota bacterium]|jgi:hypothetical protein